MDAEGHLKQQTAGSGLLTVRSFNATTGCLTIVSSGSGNAEQSQSYTYDLLGNPLSRSDANTNLSETLTYDALNLLMSAVSRPAGYCAKSISSKRTVSI